MALGMVETLDLGLKMILRLNVILNEIRNKKETFLHDRLCYIIRRTEQKQK